MYGRVAILGDGKMEVLPKNEMRVFMSCFGNCQIEGDFESGWEYDKNGEYINNIEGSRVRVEIVIVNSMKRKEVERSNFWASGQ